MLDLYLQYELKVFQTIRNSLGIFSINCQALQVWCCFKFGAASSLVLLCGTKLEAPHISRIKLCNWIFMLDLYLQYELKVFQTIPNSLGIFSINCQSLVLLQVWCCYAEPNLKHPIFRELHSVTGNLCFICICNTN